MNINKPSGKSDFDTLNPNNFLHIIEKAHGKTLTSICRPYQSYINRVFELETEEGESLVAKFYRPGRWKKEALQDEHDFLLELAAEEIPVVAPLILTSGETLGESDGLFFALFPKKGGRITDELLEDDWLKVGRLLGRVHQVGAQKTASSRIIWQPDKITREQTNYILEGGFIGGNIAAQYRETTSEFIELAAAAFKETKLLRIHADFHFANLIYRPEENFLMIDFDDMAMGPAVQDMWMLLPGYRSETQQELSLLAEGYEAFRDFPWGELKLIEILRAMRYIHFSAWYAHQVNDGGFNKSNPNWGTEHYWQEEIRELREQIERINADLAHFENY